MDLELGLNSTNPDSFVSLGNFETTPGAISQFPETEIANEVCQLLGTRTFRKSLKTALKLENLNHIDKKSYSDLLSLPKKMYLNYTIVPALVNGLAYVAHERPICPIKTLAIFLLKNKNLYETEAEIEAEQRGTTGAAKSKSRLAALVSKTATSMSS